MGVREGRGLDGLDGDLFPFGARVVQIGVRCIQHIIDVALVCVGFGRPSRDFKVFELDGGSHTLMETLS